MYDLSKYVNDVAEGQETKARWCDDCGKKLADGNPNRYCFVDLERRRELLVEKYSVMANNDPLAHRSLRFDIKKHRKTEL